MKAALDENTYERASRSATRNSRPSTSSATSSTASGTIASRQEYQANAAKCSTYF